MKQNDLPIIGIVGRPNTGKSSLFNRLTRKGISIVHSEPGVTRDRITAPMEHEGRKAMLVDTGGVGMVSPAEDVNADIDSLIREQVDSVLREAAVLIWVVDCQDGVTALDEKMAELLWPYRERVVVAANKADNIHLGDIGHGEFAVFGFEDLFAISCSHSSGLYEMLDAVFEKVPDGHVSAGETPRESRLHLAVVGRPNAGKSALINTLFGRDRVMVSDTPGTTRDAVEVPLDLQNGDESIPAVLIDTGGFRARRKVKTPVDHYSVIRAKRAVERADAVVLMIDATDPGTAQDRRIAHIVQDAMKPCVILANKWDLMEGWMPEKDGRRLVHSLLPFMKYCPCHCVSALTGYNLEVLVPALQTIREQLQQHIPTGVINRFFGDLVAATPPPSGGGRQGKVYYATMVGERPPHFRLFVNQPSLFTRNYLQYMRNAVREAFYPQSGIPINIEPVPRHRSVTELHGGRRAAAAGSVQKKRKFKGKTGPGPRRRPRRRKP